MNLLDSLRGLDNFSINKPIVYFGDYSQFMTNYSTSIYPQCREFILNMCGVKNIQGLSIFFRSSNSDTPNPKYDKEYNEIIGLTPVTYFRSGPQKVELIYFENTNIVAYYSDYKKLSPDFICCNSDKIPNELGKYTL